MTANQAAGLTIVQSASPSDAGARVETGGTVVHSGWPVWFWALLTAAGLTLAAGTAYTAIRRRKD
ncbi:hypothetical protein [Arthrobacter bambusae]|uniref:Peptidase n=1 Tax=Arthrobacter bambusae TaxID=1338426 RepID=A0AAW8DDQ1_9MICC|nr:hypothetical protein [Arthrobacter bambusae]MDP9904633.1 hypothetical protein [Arthrobacter bambusae]